MKSKEAKKKKTSTQKPRRSNSRLSAKERKYAHAKEQIRTTGTGRVITKKQLKELEDVKEGAFLKDIFTYRKLDVLPFQEDDDGSSSFFDFAVSKNVHISKDQIRLISKAMIKYYYENETAISFDAFVIRSGVSARSLRNWIERYDFFYEAWEFCKSIISYRREMGGLSSKYNPQVVMKSMHHYNEDYRRDRDENLRHKGTDETEPLQLILPDYFQEPAKKELTDKADNNGNSKESDNE